MSDGVETLRARIAELMPRARKELSELVAIPSVADPRQYPPQECARAAKWVADRSPEPASATYGSPRHPTGAAR
jgi:acetylornithine deacetylase/succinyl-diaminopimelate desuccinylase-like protein